MSPEEFWALVVPFLPPAAERLPPPALHTWLRAGGEPTDSGAGGPRGNRGAPTPLRLREALGGRHTDPGGGEQGWAGATLDSCACLSLSPGNGYVSARASPGLLPVANGNSLTKVVPAKSPPPPTHSAQLGAPSRKPDLRVITSQGGKGLMHHLVSGGPGRGLGVGERRFTGSYGFPASGTGTGDGREGSGRAGGSRAGRPSGTRGAALCFRLRGGWGGCGQECGAGGRTLNRPLVLFLLPD